MFLTDMPKSPIPASSSLERLVRMLPSPLQPLHGQHAAAVALPDNIICFCRRSATDLNRPQRGRALHHRYVLIIAMEAGATVAVDDRAIRLRAGEGLLVLPFQFHDYVQPAQEKLTWLFVTFEMSDNRSLEALRFRAFSVSPAMRQLLADLIRSYLNPKEADLTIMIFALLLARIKQADPLDRRHHAPAVATGLIMQVNQLAQGKGEMPTVKEMARSLNISSSHLRARFRASCGVSLGRHLRRLRMEKACGLLRLSTNRVSEIGEQCGFNSIFSFSRAFRSCYGISPLAYRRGGRPHPRK
jgi:AraC-like DNA-binding protein